MNKFEAVMNYIKFKAFGKVTIHNNRPKQQEKEKYQLGKKRKGMRLKLKSCLRNKKKQ